MGNFAIRLKELRKSHNMSQDDLSKAIGVSRSTIGNYEQGIREPQDHETLELFADYFNVDIDYLLGRKDWTTQIEWDPRTQSVIVNEQVISSEDQLLLDAFHAADPIDRYAVLKILGIKGEDTAEQAQ